MSISVDKNSPRINKCIVVKSASSDIGSIKITLAFHRRRKTADRMAYPPVVPVAHIVDPDDMLKLLDRIDLTPAIRICLGKFCHIFQIPDGIALAFMERHPPILESVLPKSKSVHKMYTVGTVTKYSLELKN